MTEPRKNYPIAENLLIGILVVTLACAVFVNAPHVPQLSPWVWVQIPRTLSRFGPLDAAFEVILYAGFYLSLFVVPYAMLRFLFFTMFLNGRPGRWTAFSPGSLHSAFVSVAAAVGGSALLLLPELSAFWKRLPSGNEGALLIIASGLLMLGGLGGGYRAIRSELRKAFVVLEMEEFVLCSCKQCERQWVYPVSGLERRVLPRDGDERSDRNFQYPID